LISRSQAKGFTFTELSFCVSARIPRLASVDRFVAAKASRRSKIMKFLLLASMLLIAAASSPLQNPQNPQGLDLPELHKIHKATLAPNYGCHLKEGTGYGPAALYLSKNSRGAELLFNGGCGPGSRDNLTINMDGGDMNLIADMGKVQLEDLSADQPFILYLDSGEPSVKFTFEAQIELGHTYAVLVNKTFERALFYFTVTGYLQNKRLELRYAVEDFHLATAKVQSPGFSWDTKNTE
jgi:hypothetical protein